MTEDTKKYWHTSSFGGLVENIRKVKDEKKFNHLMDCLDSSITELETFPAGGDRASAIHIAIEKSKEEWWDKFSKQKTQISCRAGCAFCCHIMVAVTDDEASLLADKVRSGVSIDMEALNRQAAYGEDSSEVWLTKTNNETRCVFLDPEKKQCRIYDSRPASCRNYHVLSPAAQCDKESFPEAKVTICTVPDAEILASAAMNVSKVGSLPAMLLAKL